MDVLGVAVFCGLWYWVVKTDIGYAITHAIRQPLFVSFPIGLIMGDLPQAITIGAAVQLLYIGLVAAGSNLPADDSLAGLVAIPIALAGGLSPVLAVVIAVPIGFAGAFLDQLRKTMNVVWVRRADRYAESGSARGIAMANLVYPTAVSFFLRFPLPFLAIVLGADAVPRALRAVPEWLEHGLVVSGALLPALGFALTMFVIGRRSLLPWFFLGFFLVQYSGIPIAGAAVLGGCAVILLTMSLRTRAATAATTAPPSAPSPRPESSTQQLDVRPEARR